MFSLYKRAAIVLASTTGLLLIGSMYATELTRLFVEEVAASPIPLPRDVDIRYHDGIVRLIGKGTPTGKANAVTLGYTIVVPRRFRDLTPAERTRIIAHELMHVEQRRTYWRFYLPLYGLLYLARGYSDHPFERVTPAQPSTTRPRISRHQ